MSVVKSEREENQSVSARAHVQDVVSVLAELKVDPNIGLTTDENEARCSRDGLNKIPERRSASALERIWAQINSFLIYILIGGAAISFAFDHHLDGYVIIGVVVINVTLGYFMESKAVSATDALKNMMSAKAQVLRDGEKSDVPSTSLVAGDIFFLQPGDVVPADGRVIKVTGLSVLESALTGESHAILKDTASVQFENAALAERKCIVFSGTQVLQGTATVVTTATGARCEIGKISGLMAAIEPEKTPLLVQLDTFGMVLSGIIIVLALLTFGIAYARHHTVPEALAIAIGVAVAAIPEGLPSCITVTFSIGVSFMAQRHAIIKSLPAVETLGSVSVICSDKTGTLTINQMTVKSVCTSSAYIELNDNGIVVPTGESASAGTEISLASLLPGILCNDSVVKSDKVDTTPTEERQAALVGEDIEMGELRSSAPSADSLVYTVTGDPTESCLVALAVNREGGAAVKSLLDANPRLEEIPFDSATKYMATLHLVDAQLYREIAGSATNIAVEDVILPENNGKIKMVMVKGAPEKVLSLCCADAASSEYWLRAAEKKAQQGMRVLALAYRIVPDDFMFAGHLHRATDVDASERCHMVALVGIMDPPRPEAIVAVARAQHAGITVKMITGDHPVTALAIGRMLGLRCEHGHALTGNDLDRLLLQSMATFDETILRNDLFARTTPEHKLRIVDSLRRQGLVCSMTGDGVNDAPALKAANIGVAMGITGTEVAKDAADMIIADDNFATIVDAIRVGRCVYANLIKIIAFVLPSNGGQAFSILGALIIDVAVPITALQILWVNMITSVTLGIVLAFDRPDEHALEVPPRRANKSILSRLLTWRLVSVTVLLVLVVLGIFQWEKQRHSSINYLRTVAVNALSAAQVGYIFNCRNIRLNLTLREIFLTGPVVYLGVLAVAVFQALFTYSPGFQFVFETEGLDGESWGKILLLAVCVFVTVEFDKYVAQRVRDYRFAAAPEAKGGVYRDVEHAAPGTAVVEREDC